MGDRMNWKEKARNYLKEYYNSFGDTQWHTFDVKKDSELLRAKICFAWFGPPKNDAEDIRNAYNYEQQQNAKTIVDKIKDVYNKSSSSSLEVGFVFVACKQDDANVNLLPIISIFVGTDRFRKDKRNFIDTEGRIYQDWDDWKKNNKLPKCKYAYPTLGYFTCSGDDSYMYDPCKDPDIEFGESPQSSLISEATKWTDRHTSVISLGFGIFGIAACFTPVTPVLLTAAAYVGGASAVYGAGRATSVLIDKGKHGQSLHDLESLTLWASLAATPLHFISSSINVKLVRGAQQGKDFSSSMRMTATVLNLSTFGVDTAMLGIANLIQKYKKDKVTALDLLQFSMSVFFFTNTVIQPKVASKIINKAQEQHFEKMANSMSDEAAKKIFKKFLDKNKSGGSINERSKIVRTINRMDDPNKFFNSVGPDATTDIKDRKGKTVIVGNVNGIQEIKLNSLRKSDVNGMNSRDPQINVTSLVIEEKVSSSKEDFVFATSGIKEDNFYVIEVDNLIQSWNKYNAIYDRDRIMARNNMYDIWS